MTPQPHPRRRIGTRTSVVLLSAASALTLNPSPLAADAGPWTWPVADEPEILRAFDPPEQPWLSGHRGLDLAADPGTPIRAAGAGWVSFAGEVAGTPVVAVTHGELRTTYLPVEADAELDRGDQVNAGDELGELSSQPQHCSEVSCLHWGLLRGEDYLDPLTLLGYGEMRLLPLSDVAGMAVRTTAPVTPGDGPADRPG